MILHATVICVVYWEQMDLRGKTPACVFTSTLVFTLTQNMICLNKPNFSNNLDLKGFSQVMENYIGKTVLALSREKNTNLCRPQKYQQ